MALELESNDVLEIILALNTAVVGAFKTSKTQDIELIKLKNDAHNHVEEFSQWLFGATTNHILEIK